MPFIVNKSPDLNAFHRGRPDSTGKALETCTVFLSIWNPSLQVGGQPADTNPYNYLSSSLGAGNQAIRIVNSEPLSITCSTSWKDGPGASIAGKINDLFNSKLMKGLGGSMFSPGTPTDSWTQQVVESGSPLSIKLKFRSYYNSRITTNVGYINLMRFFTVISAAQRKYELNSAMIDPIVGAAKNMQRAVKTAKEVTDKQKEKDGETVSALKNVVCAVAEATNLEQPDTSDNAPRAQYTLKLSTPFWKCEKLDWILKSWTATPSQQFILNNNKPMPLWIDFDLDLETNTAPSNWFVTNFFSRG